MHPADVRAAIEKLGLTLSRLSEMSGYHHTAAGKALRQPWPAVERVIAKRLRRRPQEIWPSRYDPLGNPLRDRRGRKRNTARGGKKRR